MSVILPVAAVLLGLVVLVVSADRFVGGSAVLARHFGVPPLLIGMVVVGFGTSAPEMAVSVIAAVQGSPGIALGNAYGSNIANIALILGVTALVSPLTVHSRVLRRELPVLAGVTALAAFQLWRGGVIDRLDALALLGVFGALLAWTIRQAMRRKTDALGQEVDLELDLERVQEGGTSSPGRATVLVVVGLVLLIASSRLLVWGAVQIAQGFGVSDLVIGLTVVALGTSLPELASSVAAARKGEYDIALGNVIGSNLFNTLVVVGLAGLIRPIAAGPEVLSRDVPVMAALTVSLFVMGYGFRGPGRINRLHGLILVTCYVAYVLHLAREAFSF